MDARHFIAWVEDTGINNMIWTTDLDHTVLDMVKDANQVAAAPGLEDIFHALDLNTEGRFHPVTGREMEYVDRIFPMRPLKASTEYHSMMRWEDDGEPQALFDRPQWDVIDPALNSIIEEFWPDDFRPRQKPFMRSLHISHVPALQSPDTKAHVTALIQNALDQYAAKTGQTLTLIDGGSVFDIAPDGATKAAAMGDILNHYDAKYPDRLLTPVYFGDSPGDLPAVPIVQAVGGKFIAVGNDPRVTKMADFQFPNPAECRNVFSIASRLPHRAPRFKSSNPQVSVGPEVP